MYFSTLVAFAVLPFLVVAIPVSPKTSRAKGIRSIPLTKNSVNYLNSDGHVNTRTVQAAIDQTEAFVFPLPFICEGWILNGLST
jgi:hypothetical protein